MSLKDHKTLLEIFEKYLADQHIEGNPETLYEPVRYMLNLGGKRIRPVLLLMAYNMWFDDVTPALRSALAIEYFHNFTLIHDDIMDEASLRRGHQSVHEKFGKNAAILSGDSMLIKSFDYLIGFENDHRLGTSISQVLSKTALEICEGQQMDMDFETSAFVTEQDYIEMIRKKTACLIGACLQIGAMLTNASKEKADKLYSFGENIGIAFQIRDDILDVFGDSHETGKQQGGDILRGKKNFLYVSTYNRLAEEGKKNFVESYARAVSDHNINPIMAMYEELRLKEYAGKIQADYLSRAFSCMDDLPSLDTSMLADFTKELASRKH